MRTPQAVAPPRLPKCVSLASIDLLGRTGLARLHLRVRFEVADEVRPLSAGLVGPVWIYRPEVTRDPSVGYSGVRTVLPLGRKYQDRQERRTSLPGVRRRADR